MKKKNKAAEEGASWMDTYGDMVTLLLCFFVLLYSMSSLDQVKWENLVKSLNPNAAKEVSQVVMNPEINDGEMDVPGTTELEKDLDVDAIPEDDLGEELTPEELAAISESFDAMYEQLKELEELAGEDMDVQVAKGDGYTFITFRDRVFFGGDSWVLLDEGRMMIDRFSEIITPHADAVKQIQIFGHTSQARPDQPNNVYTDRELSAMRGAVVTAYLQEKNVIDPSKLVSSSYGQFHPIAPFDTEENRAKNRRVEILITKTGDVERSLSEYYEQVYNQVTE